MERDDLTMGDVISDYASALYDQLKDDKTSSDQKTLLHRQFMESITAYEQIRHGEEETWNNQKRFEIEQAKIEANKEIEKSKQKLSKGRAALEVIKILVPAVTSGTAFVFGLALSWNVEKDGRLNSRLSNIVLNQIPKIWKW